MRPVVPLSRRLTGWKRKSVPRCQARAPATVGVSGRKLEAWAVMPAGLSTTSRWPSSQRMGRGQGPGVTAVFGVRWSPVSTVSTSPVRRRSTVRARRPFTRMPVSARVSREMAWEEKCSCARRMWRTVAPSSAGVMIFVMVSIEHARLSLTA